MARPAAPRGPGRQPLNFKLLRLKLRSRQQRFNILVVPTELHKDRAWPSLSTSLPTPKPFCNLRLRFPNGDPGPLLQSRTGQPDGGDDVDGQPRRAARFAARLSALTCRRQTLRT